ncbi:hypothetical protein [Roseisalinus antarcticus]|uniref:Uncharacterized protein n=1 Tax=Roseisalinus antarcticus TaxID=254357 RepID=A0A1Y5SS53_9RHOB|nr:hypothetical protein [Roseisalinus antarcticus]SLN46995.1 hypothetical protein ROA7023_01957 [Roseisalinus antarcticus]
MEISKTPLTEEQIARRRAGRILARAIWRQRVIAANPDSTQKDRNQIWKTEGKAETRKAMQLIKRLEKSGISFSYTPPVKADKGAEGAETAA